MSRRRRKRRFPLVDASDERLTLREYCNVDCSWVRAGQDVSREAKAGAAAPYAEGDKVARRW